MNDVILTERSNIVAIADAIRTKTERTDTLTFDEMADAINSIESSGGINTSDATATAGDILNGKTAYVDGVKLTGNIPSQGAKTITPTESSQVAVAAGTYASGDIVVDAIPSEYIITEYASAEAKDIVAGKTAYANGKMITGSMPKSTLYTPGIFVDANGLISASTTHTTGYAEEMTKASIHQLDTKAAATITPKTTSQTIAAGTYLTGDQIIAGDANLVAANIVSGKSIFGVAGSHTCEGAVLNFEVVGGTTQPTNPKENTIWVNTANDITSYTFSATAPESPAEGAVWLITSSDGSLAKFEALADDTVSIVVYPDAPAYQYIGGQWVGKPTSLYQSGAWTTLSVTHTVIPNISGYPASSWTNSVSTYWSVSINTSTGMLTFKSTGTSTSGLAGRLTSNPIDITKFNTLTVVGTFKPSKTSSTTGSGTARVQIGIDSSNISSSFLASTSKAVSFTTSDANGAKSATINASVDISSITGDNYIKIYVTRPNAYISASLEITSLILSS